MAGDFVRGLTAPLRALKLLRREKRLRRIAAMPLLINIILFAMGVPLVVWLVVNGIGDMLPETGALQGALRLALQIIAAAAIVVGSVFIFVIVGNIIAAPFNSKLSQAVEEIQTGRPAVDETGIVTSTGRSIITAIGRLFIFILLYPPIMATALIPVVGPVLYPVLGVIYGSFVLSLDFTDPTFERHIARFRDKVGFIRRRKALYLGFGLTAVGIAFVPFLNLLFLPIEVVAAAMLFLEERG